MHFEIVGWPADGPTLDLDHREFSYAGKFVMSSTGKAVVRSQGDIVAAVSFSEDRTDSDRMWIRYLTVRRDRRGEGIGARLAAISRAQLLDAGYRAVRTGANNPYSYHTFVRAGFGYTGQTTGLAEVVLSTAVDPTTRYTAGYDALAERDSLSAAERAFLEDRREQAPPEPVDVPDEWLRAEESP